jgi:hypothetical protein
MTSSGLSDRPIQQASSVGPAVNNFYPFHFFSEQDGCEYCAHVLRDAVPKQRGIVYLCEGVEALLEWRRVLFAIAAEVGEPEGVRTIVFDLLVERTESKIVAFRLDADPCEEALPLAVALADALGPDRTAVSLKTLASEGNPCLWFPDLESFEAAAAEYMLKR